MSFDAGALFLRIEARDQQILTSLNNVESGLKDTAGRMDKLEKETKDSFSAMGRSAAMFGVALSKAWDLGTMGISMVMRSLVAGGKAAIGMASDAGELGSKFGFVFGTQAKAAQQELDDFGAAVGRSKQDLYGMASGVQAILVPMGFTRDMSAEMSIAMTKLATDIGSFNNEADTEVMDALKSAMIGNAEAVRKYGIIISETTLNQELMAMGIAKGTEGASEQQKAMARLNIIMKSTTDAQGDAERTSGSFANSVKGLWAIVADLGVEFGNTLLPTVGAFVDVAKDMLHWIQANAEYVTAWEDTFHSWAEYVIDSVQAAIEIVMNYDLYWRMLSLTIQEWAQNAAGRVQWFATNAWEFVKWFFTNFWDIAQTVAGNYIQLWTNVLTNFTTIMSNVWKIIKSGGKEGFGELIDVMTQDLKGFGSSPDWKEFKGADLSKDWDELGADFNKRMGDMGESAKKTAKETKKAFNPKELFGELAGKEGGSKAKEIKVAITGIEEQFRKTLTARFEDSDAKKGLKLADATARNTEEIVKKTEEGADKVVKAVEENAGAAE